MVITTKQEHKLQRELTFAFWSAWILITAGYFVQVHALGALIAHPDNLPTLFMLLTLVPASVTCIFVCINTIASVIFRVWNREIEKRFCCKHLAVALCKRFTVLAIGFVAFGFTYWFLVTRHRNWSYFD